MSRSLIKAPAANFLYSSSYRTFADCRCLATNPKHAAAKYENERLIFTFFFSGFLVDVGGRGGRNNRKISYQSQLQGTRTSLCLRVFFSGSREHESCTHTHTQRNSFSVLIEGDFLLSHPGIDGYNRISGWTVVSLLVLVVSDGRKQVLKLIRLRTWSFFRLYLQFVAFYRVAAVVLSI